jgi:hypothetical protein
VHATLDRGVHTTWRALPPPYETDRVETWRARAIAERFLADVREPDGTPLLLHVRRVAARTPPEARVVAWLHEVLGETNVSEQQLLAEGLSGEELRALRLLSRPNPSESEAVYRAHREFISRAAGRSGQLARLVNRAEQEDRLVHSAGRDVSSCTRRAVRQG